MGKKGKYPIGSGFSSILMIFVVLCLTTFGVLSFTSAKADYNLTEKNGAYITEYYKVDAKAQEILAEIDSILVESRKEMAEGEKLIEKLKEKIVEKTNLSGSIEMTIEKEEIDGAEQVKLSYTIFVSERQNLEVEIHILPSTEEKRYEVTKYNLRTKEQDLGEITIEEDETGNGLWKGN